MTTPRNASNDGRGLQTFLDALFLEYERLGIARIRKVDPPVRVFGTGRHRKVVFLKNPWLDYAGVIKGGRAVVIEAKSTGAKSLPIPTDEKSKSSGIQLHQQEIAIAMQRLGAVAFFLWMHAGDLKIVTPAMVSAALLTRKSVRWCDAMPIARGPGALSFDPLASFAFLPSPETTQPQ